jgi:hypothetical protein
VGVQESSGSQSGYRSGAGISVEVDSEWNAVEARKLAVMLMDAADALEDMGQ